MADLFSQAGATALLSSPQARPLPEAPVHGASLRRRLPGLAVYALALGLCLGLLTWTLQLWRGSLHVPYAWSDSLFTTMQVKSMLENGWYFRNPALGAPGTSQLYDFPILDSLHFAVIKGLALSGLDAPALVNLYFLLTFPLTTLTTLFVLRRFGVSAPAALVASLLYTLCPYHFLRGTCHLFLSAFYTIPLVMLVALRLYQEPALLLRWRGPEGRPARALGCLFVCLLASCSGAYYAFFTGFFLAVAGLTGALSHRRLAALVSTGLLLLVLVAGFLANVAPSLLHAREHGKNLATRRTSFIAAEVFGLKVTHLVMPVSRHRLKYLAELSARYEKSQGPPCESIAASLGSLGTLGFFLLLVRLLRRRPLDQPGQLADGLAVLNVAALLLGTVGGFGCLFALFVDPSIRCYNRLSICIAFLALFALALVLDRLGARWRHRGWLGRLGYIGLCAAILALGYLDQTTSSLIPAYQFFKCAHKSDKAFVSRIEEILPPGSMVLQLPLVAFPESHVAGMADYEHFRGYLYSHHLRWSFGALRGREGGHWQQALAGRPLDELLPTAAVVGFDGLWLKRGAYADKPGTEAYLRRALGTEPLCSEDGEFLFFDLRPYAQSLHAKTSAAEWEWRRQTSRYPLVFSWRAGFQPPEGAKDHSWHWCISPRGDIAVLNPASYARTVRVTMRCAGGNLGGTHHLTICGPLHTGQVELLATRFTDASWTMVVPPGQSILRFHCDAPPIRPGGGDDRSLFFHIDDFTAQEIDDTDSARKNECLQVYEGLS